MARCVRNTSAQRVAFFHWSGSLEPDISPTETGRYALRTDFCCSHNATVGAKNQEIYMDMRLKADIASTWL